MNEFLFWYFVVGAIVFLALLIVAKQRAVNLLLAPLLWPIATIIVVRWWALNWKVKDIIYCGWCGYGKSDTGLTKQVLMAHVLTDCPNHPMREKLDRLEAENERRTDALNKVAQWAEAYPLEIFPEPDLKVVRELLAAGGIPIDYVSASNMRHVVKTVAEIAKEGLK